MNSLSLLQETGVFSKQALQLELKEGQIRVWSWRLVHESLPFKNILDILSGDEVARAGSFKFERDQRRFVAARAGLRVILAGILGDAPEALRFEYGRRGKPALWDQEGPQGLRFNLSHSGDLAVLAVARGLDMGVDVEEERKDRAFLEMAQFAFNAEEKNWLFSQDMISSRKAFYKLWTMKEAVLKATGEGLGAALKSYTILPGASDHGQVLDYESGRRLASWQLCSFTPMPGFNAALAYDSRKIQEIQLDSGTSIAYLL